MKRTALWIVMIAFALVVMSSAPGYSAVKWDRSGPVGAADHATTSTGSSEPIETGDGDDGDADGVAGLKDPSRGMSSALPEVERFVLRLRGWWMLFLKH